MRLFRRQYGINGRDQNAGGAGIDHEWQAVATYANWKVTEKWRLALRLDWFGETTEKGAASYRLGTNSQPVDISSQTLTIGHSLGGRSEIRVELRHDGATAALYKDGASSLKKNQDTAAIAWVFGF